MAERRHRRGGCQPPTTPNPLGATRAFTRAKRQQALYLVVPRACQRDRGPLALLSALSYFGGEATLECIALYWGVTEWTTARWARRADFRGWVCPNAQMPNLCRASGRGHLAWRACRKERIPAELRGELTLCRMGLWGRLKRRRAFGTRLLAQDCRCARSTVQRALTGPLFGVLEGFFAGHRRFRTPLRWALLPKKLNAPIPKPFSREERERPPPERPGAPQTRAPVSLAGILDVFAAGLGFPGLAGSRP